MTFDDFMREAAHQAEAAVSATIEHYRNGGIIEEENITGRGRSIESIASRSQSSSPSILIGQLHPDRRMIAGVILTSDGAVHTGRLKALSGSRAQ
jgi:hypothetical protein